MLSRYIGTVTSKDLVDDMCPIVALGFLERRIKQATLLDCMYYKDLIEVKIMSFKAKQDIVQYLNTYTHENRKTRA